MEKNLIAQCRYEYLSAEGKVWTEWFPFQVDPFSEEEAKDVLKNIRSMTQDIDRKTKLKHEYKELLISDYEAYINKKKADAAAAKADFKTIEKMKKPWAKESRKTIKKLREMSNAEKVQWKANKNS